jgi:hypothetical protein
MEAIWRRPPMMDAMDSEDAAEAVIARLTERLARADDPGLPRPGTTISAALAAEADALGRQAVPVPGDMAAGFTAGRNRFLRGLRDRAAALRSSPDDIPRPAPPPPPAPRPDPAPPPAEPPPPKQPPPKPPPSPPPGNNRYERRRNRKAKADAWPRPIVDTSKPFVSTTPPVDLRTALRQEVYVLQARLTERAGADGRWRDQLAAELRKHADEMTATPRGTGAFAAGFGLAAQSLARRLRQRADEIALLSRLDNP